MSYKEPQGQIRAKRQSGPTVLAFGGNALLPDTADPDFQNKAADAFAFAVMRLIAGKEGMVLVHGNGPQVGMILLRIDATRSRMPPESLDVLVAETQGSIGYLLCRALRNRIPNREVAALLTQVLVDAKDPGFVAPSKPVGPFYSRSVAGELERKNGWTMIESPGRGWRRVVPSPRPREIVELYTIAHAVSLGHLVIAGGGGGIPVIRNELGGLQGVEAVIDKDLTASLLAVAIDAMRFVILTNVPHISTGYGTEKESPIARMSVADARRYLAAGEFPPGSMGPKVEASVSYVESTGRCALVTNLEKLSEALQGKEGTRIVA
ncbi:Carbamate kinase [uncultured archaeon]|nr:Carbamate kinase [uncultured archaeon]